MEKVSLNGAWTLSQVGNRPALQGLDALIPGCVHLDLWRNGRIEDPFYRDNDAALRWIGETNWRYQRTFEVSRNFIRLRQVILCCEGLDTLATIRINGHEIGTTENMFRVYEFNIKKALRAGENTIEIEFAAPLPYVESHEVGGLRKARYHFGSEIAPPLPTMGIWRDIHLLGVKQGRIHDVRLTQTHHEHKVELRVQLSVTPRQRETVTAVISLARDGLTIMDNRRVTFDGDHTEVVFEIHNPSKWFPNGLGKQGLYEVLVGLFDRELNQLDYDSKRFGICEIDVQQAASGFHLVCNGEPLFIKGAHWVPPTPYTGQNHDRLYRELLQAAKDANINLLRVWGGGVYEDSYFYHLCDEMGILVWQDLMFTETDYPDDAAFVENIRAEIEDNVRRIRHQACVALWSCVAEVAPIASELIHVLDTQTPLLPIAPHGTASTDDDKTSDKRVYDDIFGFAGFPAPDVLKEVLHADDEQFDSAMMAHHQRTGMSNAAIATNCALWFHPAKDFEAQLWLSQIMQGHVLQLSVEKWRREMPETMGVIYWHLNDMWAVGSGSSIDWQGNWKAAHYMAKRFYAHMLVSAVVDVDDYQVELFVTSDDREAQAGTVAWSLTTITGDTVIEETDNGIRIPAWGSESVLTLDLAEAVAEHGADNLLLWVSLRDSVGTLVSETLVTLVAPKLLELPMPKIEVTTREAGGDGYEVNLKTDVPALYVWLDLKGAQFSDNFFHLPAHHMRTIHVSAPSLATLKVHSLVDTYRG